MIKRFFNVAPVALALLLAPLASTASAQAVATICKDATTSTVRGRGACSGHGGIDRKATAAAEKAARAAAKAAKAEAKAASTQVTCADNTMSAGGRGACSGHGGIARTNRAERKAEKAEVKADRAAEHAAVVGSGAREDNNPAGAIAKCRDGLYSHAKERRGACSRHGGVATWM